MFIRSYIAPISKPSAIRCRPTNPRHTLQNTMVHLITDQNQGTFTKEPKMNHEEEFDNCKYSMGVSNNCLWLWAKMWSIVCGSNKHIYVGTIPCVVDVTNVYIHNIDVARHIFIRKQCCISCALLSCSWDRSISVLINLSGRMQVLR